MRQLPLLMFFASALCFAQQSQKPAPETREVNVLAPECAPQKPRFPPAYGKFPELDKAASGERTHAIVIAQKHADSGLNVEAMLQEIDLDGDGTCDVVVSVRDPISTGGDSDVLSTLYLARKGSWLRVGAQSAEKTDRPAQLDLIKAPTDNNFIFSDFAALRHRSTNRTYLVTWSHERVANNPSGYQVLELAARGTLRALDKWTGAGADIYASFKTIKSSTGNSLFDPEVEAKELAIVCHQSGAGKSPGLLSTCRKIKR